MAEETTSKRIQTKAMTTSLNMMYTASLTVLSVKKTQHGQN